MSKLFYYKREVKSKVGEREVVNTFWDCINIDCVVRGLWRDKNTFSLLLNDGHEQAEDRQKPIIKNGKPVGYEVKRERDWFYSQVDLLPEDAIRFRNLTDIQEDGRELIKVLEKDIEEPEGQLEIEKL